MERTFELKETVHDSDDDSSSQEEKNVHLTKKDEICYLVGDKSSRIRHIDANTETNADVNQCELISVDGFGGKCDTSTKIQDNDVYLRHVDTCQGPISDKNESAKIVLVNTVEQVKRTIDLSTNNISVDITGVNTDKDSNTNSFLFDRTFVNSDNVLNKVARVSISQGGASSNNLAQQRMDARNRWKRAARSVQLINHMTANIRPPTTLDEVWQQQQVTRDDAGGVGAAAFEGAKTEARTRSKGRKGMEGLIVRQDRGLITFFQDFYVACLKMSIGNFLIGVFLAPLALGLLFTPVYFLDVDGLSFNGVVPEDATTSPLVSARQRCLAFLNIFLYALSLSTTFGGAPVAARSPFCLLVANMNTLMAQFLFVFLSGAVFARMSQPSYPIRCAKKAVIKTDDLLPVLGLKQEEKYRVFSVRLVLTGPSPCEMVDIKVCLTFRIFVTLPSGSVFCSTHDLEVVRPEVSYLRYGLMVRHIIDQKSPVYGHTIDTLKQGDASFSLTVMGLERTSMQPVFHLEDYFVCDDDVIWEADYEDFIYINKDGQRVLDHSRIDKLKSVKGDVQEVKKDTFNKVDQPVELNTSKRDEDKHNPLWRFSMRKRRVVNAKSTSFTRADW